MASNEFSTTEQSKNTSGLKAKLEDEKLVGKFGTRLNLQRVPYQFQLNVDITINKENPIFQKPGKSIFEAEWINQESLPIILLQIDGVKPKQKASFYVQLSSHPHIVHTYGLVENNPGSIVLVQERAPQGNLSDLLRKDEFKPSERVLWDIFQQICDAMIFLTDQSIIHGNLACQNVLVFQMNSSDPKKNLVKLTDFGLIKSSKLYSVNDRSASTIMTTIFIRHAAPELLKNPKKFECTEKSDVYSMGVLMWETCSYGDLPYSNINDYENIRQLKLKDGKLSRPPLCSDQLWSIINECWNIKPRKRSYFKSLKQYITDLQSKSTIKLESELIHNENLDHSRTSSQISKPNDSRYGNHDNYKEQDNNIKIIEQNDAQCYNYPENLAVNETNLRHVRFAREYFSSSIDVHDHLIHCGTKTDQCPNCQKFIQRAIFAYHYENNCVDINEVEISNDLHKSYSHRFTQFSPNNSKERVESTMPDFSGLSEILECEFCHNKCARSDYGIHKNYCLLNPMNENKKRQERSAQPFTNNCHSSNDYLLIPCEYCQEQCSAEQLRVHEASCLKKTNGRSSSIRPIERYPSASQSVRSSELSTPENDKTHLLPTETSGFPGQNPRLPSVNEHLDREFNEHHCCCCS